MTCPHCEAIVSANDAFCQDCGAPLKAEAGGETAAHQDLSRANLLRLRGELEEAEKVCRGVLRKFPNNGEAHTLLGDLASDRQDWQEALNWYELALDLNPHSTADQRKANHVRQKLDVGNEEEVVEQIGLRPTRVNPTMVLAGAVLLLVVVSALILLPKKGTAQIPATVTDTIVPPVATDAKIASTPAGIEGTPPSPVKETATEVKDKPTAPLVPDAAQTEPMEDRTLLQLLKRSSEGGRVTTVTTDPRSKLVTVTFTYKEGDDPRKLAGVLGREMLVQSPETLVVTVRGVMGDRLGFVADAVRTRLEATSDNSEASPESILQNEWPAANASTTTTTPTTTPNGP